MALADRVLIDALAFYALQPIDSRAGRAVSSTD